MKKRILALLMTVCLMVGMIPAAAAVHSTHAAQPIVQPMSIDTSGLICDSFIKNTEHRDYINMMLQYYIKSDSKLQTALSKGKSVVFMFEGGSDNYPDNAYENTLADIRNQAVSIVVQSNADGKAVIATRHETCSTIPGSPAHGIQIDGTYPIQTRNHRDTYGALKVIHTGNTCLKAPSSNKNGTLYCGTGMNIHTRSSKPPKNGDTYSDGSVWYWSEGCLLIGSGNDSSNYFNTFMRTVAGIDHDVWINYSNKKFGKVTENLDMGYCVIDRQLAKSGLKVMYNDTALSKITAVSDSARQKAESQSPASNYIAQCQYYPSYLAVETPTASKLWNMPCSDATSEDAENVGNTQAGDLLTVTALYKNTQDNYWYQVTYNGTVCYLYAGNTTFVRALYTDVTIDNVVAPSEIKVGSSFVIGGNIASRYTLINTVEGIVCTEIEDVLYASDTVNGRSYSLKSSQIDKKLTFGSLSVGSYNYIIRALVENNYSYDGKGHVRETEAVYLYNTDFRVIGKYEHVCDKGTYKFYRDTHPHYSLYQCSVCGLINAFKDETNWLNTCDECRPGIPDLNVNLESNGTATFTWIDTANTTHYLLSIYEKNAYGSWNTVVEIPYAESGFSRTFADGSYCAQLFAYNDQMTEPDSDDWVHTQSLNVFFEVGHQYSATIVDPTCTTGGYTRYTCSRCGSSYEDHYTDALGHDYQVTSVVGATCTNDGSVSYSCSRCPDSYTEIVPMLGHDMEIVVTKPTCTESGYSTGSCLRCGLYEVYDPTNATGHNWSGTICTNCGENRSNPFTDVPEGSFYYDPVLWAVEQGITSGTSETTFSPNGDCLRAQVVTFLWRAAGKPEPASRDNPFVDVNPTDFYYKAVLWAVEQGITNGADATHFNPLGVCNRAQVVTFLYRTFGSPVINNPINPFTDVPMGSFYQLPVLWAVEQGITNGVSATHFGPNQSCNRAQIVTFLYRAYN